MSEQLDRIESAIVALVADVSTLKQGQADLHQEMGDLRQELKQDIAEVKNDIARLDQRVDGIQRQLNGEVIQITQMVLNLGDQMQNYENAFEHLRLQVSNLIAEVQHMKGLFEAHMRRTDRIMDYLVRHIGNDSVA